MRVFIKDLCDDKKFNSRFNFNVEEWFEAVSQSDIKFLQDYIDCGFDIDTPNANKMLRNGLILAIRQKDFELVQFFINNGACVNKLDHLNCSALIHAIFVNRYDIVKFLIENDADVTIKTGEDLDKDVFYHAQDKDVRIHECLIKSFESKKINEYKSENNYIDEIINNCKSITKVSKFNTINEIYLTLKFNESESFTLIKYFNDNLQKWEFEIKLLDTDIIKSDVIWDYFNFLKTLHESKFDFFIELIRKLIKSKGKK